MNQTNEQDINNNNNNGFIDDSENEPDEESESDHGTHYISEEEIHFLNSCVLPEEENYVKVDGVESVNEIVRRDFVEELHKSYDPANEVGGELGKLIKMKRLTETYLTLFNKNVELTPNALTIIDQCKTFVSKIKANIRELCTHVITEDDIEIGENIMHIIYCNRCETMF